MSILPFSKKVEKSILLFKLLISVTYYESGNDDIFKIDLKLFSI